MKTTDFLKENFVNDAHEAHQDHEVQMARSDCYNAAKYAIELHKLLKHVSEEAGLDGWVSEKITLANDYLRTVAEYLRYEQHSMGSGLPEFDHGAATQELDASLAEGYEHGFADPKAPELGQRPRDHRGLGQELAHERNNYAVYIDGKQWKVFADKRQADNIARSLTAKGKKAEVYVTGSPATTEGVAEGAELKQAKRRYNQAAKDANTDQVGAGKKIDTMKKSLRQKDVAKQSVAESMSPQALSKYCEELVAEKGWDAAYKHASFMAQGNTDPAWGSVLKYLHAMKDGMSKDVDEGWVKNTLAGAALVGAGALGGAALQAHGADSHKQDIKSPVAAKVAPGKVSTQAHKPSIKAPQTKAAMKTDQISVPQVGSERHLDDPEWVQNRIQGGYHFDPAKAEVPPSTRRYNENAGGMGASSVATAPSKPTKATGTLFGGSYKQKTPKRESVIKR